MVGSIRQTKSEYGWLDGRIGKLNDNFVAAGLNDRSGVVVAPSMPPYECLSITFQFWMQSRLFMENGSEKQTH